MASSVKISPPVRWIFFHRDFNMDNLSLYGQIIEDESQLRKPFGFMKAFTNIDGCVDYITDVHDSYVVLTISGQYARHVIPHIHNFPQLAAVYVYCKPENKQRNEEWSKIYSKVKAIVSDVEEYSNVINRNHVQLSVQNESSPVSEPTSHVRIFGPTTFDVFDSTASTYKDLSAENGNFVWMQLLVEVLITMDCSKSPMDEFCFMCHEFIRREKRDWRNILAFGSLYDSFNPIKWYTKEPFVYQFLNEILREGDIDKLILLRMLVRDINNQLAEEHRKFVEPHITVYRGQAMKLTELKYLQNHLGHSISMNSFLSTSRDRDMALIFAKSIDKNNPSFESVLFEIDCDTRRLDTKPFADITHLSHHESEKEILFMLGSVFRIKELCELKNDDLWIIKMTLCGKNDYNFENLFEHLRYDAEKALTLTSLGLLFQQMGDFKRAAQCFQQHLDLSDNEDPIIRAATYHNLGNTASENGDDDKALDYFKKSLIIRLNSPSVKKIDMGALYNDIGNVYNAKDDYEAALEFYEKALQYTLESDGENHKQTVAIYGGIGDIYRQKNEYDLALSHLHKSLRILTDLHEENKPDYAKILASIGLVYRAKGDHLIALSYLKKALAIQQKMLTKNHVSLGITYNNVGETYIQTRKYDLALENFEKAQRIFQIALPIDHPNTQAVTNNIKALTLSGRVTL